MIKNIKSIIAIVLILFVSSGCGDDSNNISSIRDGIMPKYSKTTTLGNALEYWAKQQNCDSTKWEEFETGRKEVIVSFTCVVKDDVFSYRVSKYAYEATKEKVDYETKLIKDYNDELKKATKQDDIDTYTKRLKYTEANLEKALSSVKNQEKVAKEFDKLEYIFQFIPTVDGESFIEGFIGYKITYRDGKSYEKAHPFLVSAAYHGTKIDSINIFNSYGSRK